MPKLWLVGKANLRPYGHPIYTAVPCYKKWQVTFDPLELFMTLQKMYLPIAYREPKYGFNLYFHQLKKLLELGGRLLIEICEEIEVG